MTATTRRTSRLWIHKTGLMDFPDAMRIVLSITVPDNEDATSFMHGFRAEERIRIFLPSDPVGDDTEITVGDHQIIGPWGSADVPDRTVVNFVKDPAAGSGDLDINLLKGDGWFKMGMEGLDYGVGTLVNIRLQLFDGGAAAVKSDMAQIKVAPFALSSNGQAVSDEGHSAFVTSSAAPPMSGLRKALEMDFGATVLADNGLDPWQQDGYEIGYTQSPYGAMPVVLTLGRALMRPDYGNVLLSFVHNKILSPNVEVLSVLEGIYTAEYDDGGNIEAIPGSPNRLFTGNDTSADIDSFFMSQGVNTPAVQVDTSWLLVGHVDEVVSFAPDGHHVAVADPELAWALLLLADVQDPNELMNRGITFDGASTENTVGDVVSDTSLHDFNVELAANKLPSVTSGAAQSVGAAPAVLQSRQAAQISVGRRS